MLPARVRSSCWLGAGPSEMTLQFWEADSRNRKQLSSQRGTFGVMGKCRLLKGARGRGQKRQEAEVCRWNAFVPEAGVAGAFET